MKYSRRVLPKYRPIFFVEDLRGVQLSDDYDSYYGFGCSIEAFMFMLKQCTFSAAHFGADYPAYIKDSDGRLIVRMATYKGV